MLPFATEKNVCSPRPRGRALPRIRNHPQTLRVRPSQVVAGTNTFLAMTLKTAAGATSSVQAVIFTPLGADPAPQLTNYKILPAAASSAAAASAAKPAPFMKGAFSCSNTPMLGGLRCQVRTFAPTRVCYACTVLCTARTKQPTPTAKSCTQGNKNNQPIARNTHISGTGCR